MMINKRQTIVSKKFLLLDESFLCFFSSSITHPDLLFFFLISFLSISLSIRIIYFFSVKATWYTTHCFFITEIQLIIYHFSGDN